MSTPTVHVIRAWDPERPDRRALDSLILACVERLHDPASVNDKAILIAGEEGDRRAASLGLRTPFLIQPRGRFFRGIDKPLEAILAALPEFDRLLLWSGITPDDLSTAAKRARARTISVSHPDLSSLLPKRLPSGDRDSLRKLLDIAPNEYAIALASDPPDAFAAQDFVRTCALVALVGRKVAAIVPRHAPEMERAKATLRATGVPVQFRTSESPIWKILPACDGVVVDIQEGTHPRSSSDFAQRWMAATAVKLNLPVVWTGSNELPPSVDNRLLLKPQSRLPVHIARAFNEYFLEHAESPRTSSAQPLLVHSTTA